MLLQIGEQVDHLGLNAHVERAHGFVGDDEIGLGSEGTRDADALALPTRKLVRIAARCTTRQTNRIEQLVHALMHGSTGA